MSDMQNTREHSLETNKEQADFYQKKVDNKRKLNRIMKAWEIWRRGVYEIWSSIGVFQSVVSKHRNWLGDLKGKRILDLGCYTGNVLSVEIASNSEYYLGIDLSEAALDKLRVKMEKAGVQDAELRAIDFLDKTFDYEPFDIVYANAVLHHFEDFDLVMSLISDRLVPGGKIVSFDPMETALIVRIVRKIYRPFQTNASWEWPFRESNFEVIKKYYEIESIQGVVGLSKWVIPLAIFPIFRNQIIKLGKYLHSKDLESAKQLDSKLWRCMSVSLCLKKKQTA